MQWARKDENEPFIIEHLGLLSVVVVINLVYGTLKTGDLKTISLTLPIGHGVDFCNSKC